MASLGRGRGRGFAGRYSKALRPGDETTQSGPAVTGLRYGPIKPVPIPPPKVKDLKIEEKEKTRAEEPKINQDSKTEEKEKTRADEPKIEQDSKTEEKEKMRAEEQKIKLDSKTEEKETTRAEEPKIKQASKTEEKENMRAEEQKIKQDSKTEEKEKTRAEEPELKEPEVTESTVEVLSEDEVALRELLHVEDKYKPLVALLEEFCPGEDTTRHSRKLRDFEKAFLDLCPDELYLELAFRSLRAAALLNPATTRKLTVVSASPTWRQCSKLRGPFLNSMQDTFSKLDVLQRAYPKFLVNAATLMGDYYADARLANGDRVSFLAEPLVEYLKALLARDDARAHRCFTTQLMQNGRELSSACPEAMRRLSVMVRTRMLALPARAWLMLAADVCLRQFRALPEEIEDFYSKHLDLVEVDNDIAERMKERDFLKFKSSIASQNY